MASYYKLPITWQKFGIFFIGKGWKELWLLLLTNESVISTVENSLCILGTGMEKSSCCFKMLRYLGIARRHFNGLKTAVSTKLWIFLGGLSDSCAVKLSHLASPFCATHCCSQNCLYTPSCLLSCPWWLLGKSCSQLQIRYHVELLVILLHN